jgi:hypothetical protein
MEAAFPGQLAATGFVPTATQLGFAVGLILLVPVCTENLIRVDEVEESPKLAE